MIMLPSGQAALIRHEGKRAYPHYCCGVLLGFQEGKNRQVTGILPIVNRTSDQEQYSRFRIDPKAYLQAERVARDLGVDIIGVYNSRSDSPARPADSDAMDASHYRSYVIVSVRDKDGTAQAFDMRSWELASDGKSFREEGLEIMGG